MVEAADDSLNHAGHPDPLRSMRRQRRHHRLPLVRAILRAETLDAIMVRRAGLERTDAMRCLPAETSEGPNGKPGVRFEIRGGARFGPRRAGAPPARVQAQCPSGPTGLAFDATPGD